jgi:glycosyltransferase involved in cell wall biosynthesis
MNCTIINKHDLGGGAGKAAVEILESLNANSDFSTRLVCAYMETLHPMVDKITSHVPSLSKRVYSKIRNNITENTVGMDYWHESSEGLLNNTHIKNADIINLHNIHSGYFAYPVIMKLHDIAPIVVTMQDMWYLTGHCAYTYDCNGFKTGCSPCPHLDWYPAIKHNTAGFHARKKREIFEALNIPFISCSKWLISLAKESFVLKGRQFHHIFNPIRTDIFAPLDLEKNQLRKMLALPLDTHNIVLYAAFDLADSRKGFLPFVQSLTKEFVRDNNIFLLIAGKDSNDVLKLIPDYIPYKYIGMADNSYFRNMVYNASDVFVFPTLADNMPNMIVESLSSGTPTVTFDTGGCGEVIITNQTGYLARHNDFEDLKTGISTLLNNEPLKKQIRALARLFALENFSYKACSDKYSTVFNQSIAQYKTQ